MMTRQGWGTALKTALRVAALHIAVCSAARVDGTCTAALAHNCDLSRFDSPAACQICAGLHQSDLQRAGCTNTNIASFCTLQADACTIPAELLAHAYLGGSTAQLPPPADSSDNGVAVWLQQMRSWRDRCTAQLGYATGAVGPDLPGLKWTATSYINVQSHPYDNFLYDYSVGEPVCNHTVARFLDDLRQRYGGVDSILIWPTCKHCSTTPSHPPCCDERTHAML